MKKSHNLLIKNGYVYDEEDEIYEKKVFSTKTKGMFVPFVSLFSIVIYDDVGVLVCYNKCMRYDSETIEKVKKERNILKELGFTVNNND